MNAPQFLVDTEGNRTAVLLDIATYNELLEQIEDAEDVRLSTAAEQDDPNGLPLEAALAEVEAERQQRWGNV